MAESYLHGDFKKMGYILGRTLAKHSHHHEEPKEGEDLFLF